MRRRSIYQRHADAKFFRGSEMLRLGAMFGLMVIVVMLIARARDPEMWRWFVRQQEEAGRIEHVGDPSESPKPIPGDGRKPQAGAPVANPTEETAKPAETSSGASTTSPAPEQPAPVAPVPNSPATAEEPAKSPEKSPQAEQSPPPNEATSSTPDDEPDGLTDEDPEEWELAIDEFQAVLDEQLYMRPEEMIPYKRVLGWVYNQSAETLLNRATRDVPYDDFIREPKKHRGKIYALNVNIKLCRRLKEPVDDLTLFEAWGVTRQSKNFLYDGIILDPPEGFPISDTAEVSEKVTLVGYFFKVQAYYPGRAKVGQKPERAPVFIGRLIWTPAPPPSSEKSEWLLGITVSGFAVVILAIGWLFTRTGQVRSPSQAVLAASRGPGTITVGDWLDSPDEGPVSPDAGGGNNSPTDSESDVDSPSDSPNKENQTPNGLDEGRL